jgi:cell division septation protein DedD
MLTDHEMRPEHEARHDGERPRVMEETRDAQKEFPPLEEPSWLEDDLDEEMEAPRDSAFRGIWIGVAAAAVTFVLVFAIPYWLGWYEVGGPNQRTKREPTPESVISTVTAKPSGSATETPGPTAPATPPAAPSGPTPTAATPPPVALPRIAPPKEPAPPAATPSLPPARAVAPRTAKPDKPAVAAPAAKRTFSVQIAAFKSAQQASRLAARVKRDGYPADVRRVESSAVPWVVRIGGYTSREQAESARDALARKGFRGFVI